MEKIAERTLGPQVSDYPGGLASPEEIREVLGRIPVQHRGFLISLSEVLEKLIAMDKFHEIKGRKVGDDDFIIVTRKS